MAPAKSTDTAPAERDAWPQPAERTLDSSYTFRCQIAAVNDIKAYMGTANQNTQQ
jgi:hypothetical protein